MKERRAWVLLVGIFLIGFSVRYLAHGPELSLLDPWFHFRIVNYILEVGHAPQIDPLSYYPSGRAIWERDLLFLPYFIAYTYKIFQFSGISLMSYMVAFPAIFGAMACIPLYYLTKELFDEKIALSSALFYAFLPAALSRTWAGFTDKEGLAGVLIFAWLYLFIRSCKELDIRDKKTLVFPILSGMFFGLSELTWAGSMYFALVISTSALIYIIINYTTSSRKNDMNLYYTLIIMTGIGIAIMHAFQPLEFPFSRFVFDIAPPSLSFVSGVSLAFILSPYLGKKLDRKIEPYHLLATFFLTFIASVFVFYEYEEILNGTIYFVKRFILAERKGLLVEAIIAESVKTRFLGSGATIFQRFLNGDWFGHLNMTLFIFPIGIPLIAKKLKEDKGYTSLFSFVFITSGMLAMNSDLRLNFVLAPSAAIFTAYVFFHFIDGLKHKIRRYVLLLLLLLVTLSTLNAGVVMMNKVERGVPYPWHDAMVWLKQNTEEDSIIISSWDYGYWIQALANRTTIVDGGNFGGASIDVAKMFTTANESEALRIIKQYNPENRPVYVLVSYEEFGKSWAINHIAQDELSISQNVLVFSKKGNMTHNEVANTAINELMKLHTIYPTHLDIHLPINGREGLNIQEVYTLYFWLLEDEDNPEMGNKLLAKLLPFPNTGHGQGLKHFRLVYKDDHRVYGNTEFVPGYVLIYKVV